MHLTITALTLASALLAPVQEAEDVGHKSQQQLSERKRDFMESNLGFTIYQPQHLTVNALVNYAKDLTSDKVSYFFEDAMTGTIQSGRRRRFISMGNVIGIQDFEEGRDSALRILIDLDSRIGAIRDDKPKRKKASQTVMRTVRLRTLDMNTATMLVQKISPELAVSTVRETGTVVLRGPLEDVAAAETLLRDVDQPLPQVTLRCQLIQAVDADGATENLIDNDLSRSLGALLPGKRFRKVGQLFLRGSAGGSAQFEITSSLPRFGAHDAVTPARVTLKAIARGLDTATKTLTLDDFSMLLEIPTFQTTSVGSNVQSGFAGYRNEGLSADLALRAGETTVIGSLGGDEIYVSLSFTIEK